MPPEAFGDPMNESMTPQQAARVLADASKYEGAIERRTEGVTMALWGIVSSAMFVSYGFADVLGAPSWVFAMLWAPWVALGILTTVALWRSVHLARDRPIVDEDARVYWTRSVAIAFGIMIVMWFVHPTGPMYPLGITGVSYLILGTLNLFRSGPEHRRMYLYAGAILLALALGFGLTGAPIQVTGMVGIVSPAIVLCGLGLWTAFRG
ncbi:MAG TPA: hypothetical protein VM370_05560 [Candidatus Thermoplasmatota archaeon]|nr:hypothetical protein [Candidatus Thermoplasmatota archaeon]